MKIPFKFRGKRKDNGRYVFGDLIHMTDERVGIIFDKRIAAVEVEPDSVARLIGYDMDGEEVYEGDELLSYDSEDEASESPENGKVREAILYTQTNPTDLSLCKLRR